MTEKRRTRNKSYYYAKETKKKNVTTDKYTFNKLLINKSLGLSQYL